MRLVPESGAGPWAAVSLVALSLSGCFGTDGAGWRLGFGEFEAQVTQANALLFGASPFELAWMGEREPTLDAAGNRVEALALRAADANGTSMRILLDGESLTYLGSVAHESEYLRYLRWDNWVLGALQVLPFLPLQLAGQEVHEGHTLRRQLLGVPLDIHVGPAGSLRAVLDAGEFSWTYHYTFEDRFALPAQVDWEDSSGTRTTVWKADVNGRDEGFVGGPEPRERGRPPRQPQFGTYDGIPPEGGSPWVSLGLRQAIAIARDCPPLTQCDATVSDFLNRPEAQVLDAEFNPMFQGPVEVSARWRIIVTSGQDTIGFELQWTHAGLPPEAARYYVVVETQPEYSGDRYTEEGLSIVTADWAYSECERILEGPVESVRLGYRLGGSSEVSGALKLLPDFFFSCKGEGGVSAPGASLDLVTGLALLRPVAPDS